VIYRVVVVLSMKKIPGITKQSIFWGSSCQGLLPLTELSVFVPSTVCTTPNMVPNSEQVQNKNKNECMFNNLPPVCAFNSSYLENESQKYFVDALCITIPGRVKQTMCTYQVNG
jgi:hypothetical protein